MILSLRNVLHVIKFHTEIYILEDAKMYGWKIPEGEVTHNWKLLRDGVQDHIASLNWGYRVQLREREVISFHFPCFIASFPIAFSTTLGHIYQLFWRIHWAIRNHSH